MRLSSRNRHREVAVFLRVARGRATNGAREVIVSASLSPKCNTEQREAERETERGATRDAGQGNAARDAQGGARDAGQGNAARSGARDARRKAARAARGCH